MKKVVLIGYMGSGKSVIAKKLAQKINIPVVELDELIEKECGMTIATIFASKGELFFRKTEHHLFSKTLDLKEPVIISTGGGTPCYFNNHEFLKNEAVVSIYLKASIETLSKRLRQEKERRPLIANLKEEEIDEFIAKHLFDRSFYYNQAQYRVTVDDKTFDAIVNEILELLH